jgi:hypothetical protein
MPHVTHKLFYIYAADGSQIVAYESLRNILSERTQDSEPEIIGQRVTYSLKDGSPLTRLDDEHFESLSGQKFTFHKP